MQELDSNIQEIKAEWEELRDALDEEFRALTIRATNKAAAQRVRVNLNKLRKDVYVPFRDLTLRSNK